MTAAAAPVRICPSALAVQAMKGEVLLTPKPGLVDRLDSGAHSDMDLTLFLKSADSIAPYLKEMADLTPPEGDPLGVLPLIRPVGVLAEQAMFEATCGVNTHKGQIFSLGVCTAAAVRTSGSGRDILVEAGRICCGISGELSLKKTAPGTGTSHGQKAYHKYGSSGIRGEAEAGFPAVRDTSLPAYRAALAKGCTREEAGLEALLYLMTVVEDSNVLHRRGMKGLSFMRSRAEAFILSGGMLREEAYKELSLMNCCFIEENISPGGCADLLALTLLIAEIEDDHGR